MTTISVIIPVYKVKKEYLNFCIKSILEQEIKDIEIILVDDGSPDDTGDYCDQISKTDGKIKVIHKDNGGSASARNEGIRSATGEWITFIDADDWFDKELFGDFIKLQLSEGVDVVLFKVYTDYKNKRITDKSLFEGNVLLDNRKMLDKLQLYSLSMAAKTPSTTSLISVCGKFYRRRFVDANELYMNPSIKYNEDALYSLRVYEKADKIFYLDKSYYHYRKVCSSKTNQYREKAEEEQLLILKYIKEFITENKKGEQFTKAFHYRTLVSIQMCFFLKYYNLECKLKNRRRQFIKLLETEPFCSAIENLKLSELKTSFKIKYICFKFHLFRSLVLIQHLHQLKHKYESFE